MKASYLCNTSLEGVMESGYSVQRNGKSFEERILKGQSSSLRGLVGLTVSGT